MSKRTYLFLFVGGLIFEFIGIINLPPCPQGKSELLCFLNLSTALLGAGLIGYAWGTLLNKESNNQHDSARNNPYIPQ